MELNPLYNMQQRNTNANTYVELVFFTEKEETIKGEERGREQVINIVVSVEPNHHRPISAERERETQRQSSSTIL